MTNPIKRLFGGGHQQAIPPPIFEANQPGAPGATGDPTAITPPAAPATSVPPPMFGQPVANTPGANTGTQAPQRQRRQSLLSGGMTSWGNPANTGASSLLGQ